ncbi:hypothetical protein GJG85_04435 [Burkholderia sp. MS389]|nr:hypothetical protein [Burkholderia sp. AcTa6-5]QRR12689.1 hypothetical protein GJG85_04435 [Burkholderia sp. MS389]
MLCTTGAAALAFWLLGIAIKRIGVSPLDFPPGCVAISMFITVLAIAVLANGPTSSTASIGPKIPEPVNPTRRISIPLPHLVFGCRASTR